MYQEVYCILCSKELLSKRSFLCQTCEKQENSEISLEQNQKSMQEGLCPQCTFKNQRDAIECRICTYLLKEALNVNEDVLENVGQRSLIKCLKCSLENDISNQYCLNCETQLFQLPKKQCMICGFKVRQDNYQKHYQECLLSKSLIEQEQIRNNKQIPKMDIKPFKDIKIGLYRRDPLIKVNRNSIFNKSGQGRIKLGDGINSIKLSDSYCYYCYKKIQPENWTLHDTNCQKKEQWTKQIMSQSHALTPLQKNALMYMHNKSARQHLQSKKTLEQRVRRLGFSSLDLENLQYYIQNYAPIIIQIHVSKHMQFFVKDTHYRNQFQTNKSSGSLSRSSRIQWQDRMFDKTYSKSIDFQRVKYGVINFTNDPKGVKCASSYGPSYFLLKGHVRNRCTFTDKDSSNSGASIATLKFSFKVVNKMSDQQLRAAFNASKALEESSGILTTYKQVQIHGPIQFSKDIQRIYVSRSEIKGQKHLLDLVYEFSQKFKVQHDFI